ncbi:MAG TPA: tRNA 2-thiouridine(34) synthase MnmA [Syntrophobacteraceae bacterium]|nr:tRNA 2-thiouridine(34) synthase MnmA [Syntrophobacteraceae bacterium]
MTILNRKWKTPVHVAVAMSGGVDSLRAATLLKQQGHDLIALHMRLLPDSPGLCPGTASLRQSREDDLKDLVQWLGIPCHIVDLRASFETLVIQPFVAAYLSGLTPNPCSICNPQIKFGLLLNEARRLGADCLATGHYARLLPPDDRQPRFGLQRGRDPVKDQSYFLYGLTQDQLARAVFPLGECMKTEVQAWAEQNVGARVPEESQEICFIPSGRYRDYLEERLGVKLQGQLGDIVDLQGSLLGQHQGIHGYTVGQRRGLGIASTAPYYVLALQPETNRVVVGRAQDLSQAELPVEHVNWLSIAAPSQAIRCEVRIRHQHRPAPATLIPVGTDGVLVHFDQPQRAVTPGQAAVFYDHDVVLGGGTIGRMVPQDDIQKGS